MPTTRRKAATAAASDPQPTDPPASSARAVPSLHRSLQTVSTRSTPSTRSSAATDPQTEQAPDHDQVIDQDAVEEPARKRQRRKGAVEAVTATVPTPEAPANVHVGFSEAPAAPMRMTRSAARAQHAAREPSPPARREEAGQPSSAGAKEKEEQAELEQPVELVRTDEESGGMGDVPEDATSWWRYFPDVLTTPPFGMIDPLDANADDSTLLSAAVHNRSAWFDPDLASGANGTASTATAQPVVESNDDGEQVDGVDLAAAAKIVLARNENELFMSMTATNVFVRESPVHRKRWAIHVSAMGAHTRPIYYVHPDSMTMTEDQLERLTVADFAGFEANDPYYEHAKQVRPTVGREVDEVVKEDGFVDAKRGIRREILKMVVFSLNEAFWRHDGDWPGKQSAMGDRPYGLRDWTTDHFPYYRIVLRSIKGKTYIPRYPTLPYMYATNHLLGEYSYDVCIYLKTNAVNAALRDNVNVPGLAAQVEELRRIMESRNNKKRPNFYVPDTLATGNAPAPTPPGFRLTLHDHQQRTLGWLLALERSRRARTAHVRQEYAESTLPMQGRQFSATARYRLPPWIQLGHGGMWVNLADVWGSTTKTIEGVADPAVWADRLLPPAALECRGALDFSSMGAGKTITALALVAANPFRSVREIVWDDPQDKDRYLVSRATLVVVRSDLVSQWVAEAQKALPLGAKVVQLATIRDHRDLSWTDVLLADVVVVSLSFLINGNYRKRIAKVAKTRGRYCFPREAYQCGWGQERKLGFDEWKRRDRWMKQLSPDDAQAFNDQLDAHMAHLHARTRARFGTDKDCVILDRIYWHRIVIDEIHELSNVLCAPESWMRSKMPEAETLLFYLKARFRLGLTGTPPLSKPCYVSALAECVGVRNVPSTVADAQAFLNSHTRCNQPDLVIPPVHYQVKWVDLTPAEIGLMASYQQLSVRARLMMCNHHQIHDDVVATMGAVATSVNEVAARIQGMRLEKIELLIEQGRQLQDTIASLVARMEALMPLVSEGERTDMPADLIITDDNRLIVLGTDAHDRLVRYLAAPDSQDMDVPVTIPAVDVSHVKNPTADAKTTARVLVQAGTDFADVSGQLRTVVAQHRFMATVLSAIAEKEDQACPVCMDEIAQTDPLVITRCGHVFCNSCATSMLMQLPHRCAVCRDALDGAGATIRLVLHPLDEPMAEVEDDDADADADYAIYGSKIKTLVQFVRRVVREDPAAKLILFSQFHRLTALMARAFSEFGIVHVKLMGGTVITKRQAITLFRTDPNTKILFLSAEDSVSGLQLTEANHVVIVHPFLGASEAMARAYELQGIARAVRAGQEREVTVTRFVARGTIEEEITARRFDIRAPAEADLS
ncbi:hypothetical protein GGF31_007291 [Allomyces arbusculus]|nr:hypothetical protein GGF31_007291 [Allomyces arbusculus]